MNSEGSATAGLIFLIIIIGLYILPGIIASDRKHHQKLAIWVLTIVGGWTMVGWVVALVWACTAVRTKESHS